jgi:hypothetical protein
MRVARVMAMAKVLKFDEAIPVAARPRGRAAHAAHPSDDFWPEVSRGARESQWPDPANAPRRVLGEMALIVGGAGLFVLLTTIVFGTP